jgi:hypothetical protein
MQREGLQIQRKKQKKGEDGEKEEFTDTNCDSGSRQMLKKKNKYGQKLHE